MGTAAGRPGPAVVRFPAVRFLAYLGLCAAYLQGGLVKLTDFPGALAEMAHFGLAPGPVFAVLVIVLELLASAMILLGRLRWLGALALAAFTLVATGIALRYWEMAPGQERFMAANAFYEHLGLAGIAAGGVAGFARAAPGRRDRLTAGRRRQKPRFRGLVVPGDGAAALIAPAAPSGPPFPPASAGAHSARTRSPAGCGYGTAGTAAPP